LAQRAWLSNALLRLMVAAMLLSSSVPIRAGEEIVIDGVVHVKNQSEPPQEVRIHNLQEKWQIGGEDDDILLGLITRVRADEEGNIYLLDAQLYEVLVDSPEGIIRTYDVFDPNGHFIE
jgi:hypothetical protein